MSRGKHRDPFEGARRPGAAEVADTSKLAHKLTDIDDADVSQADVIETTKGFPAVDWSIDDDLVIELPGAVAPVPVSYTHLRAHETVLDLVCRLLLEKK